MKHYKTRGELCSFQDVMKYATEYAHLMGLQYRFLSGAPTKEWYYRFVKRWEQKLKLMKSIRLEKAHKHVDDWFNKLYLERVGQLQTAM